MKHRFDFAWPGLIWTWLLVFSTAAIAFFVVRTASAEDQAVHKTDKIVILAFGDSLTAGYMLPPDKSFPAKLQVALRDNGYKATVINSVMSRVTATEGP